MFARMSMRAADVQPMRSVRSSRSDTSTLLMGLAVFGMTSCVPPAREPAASPSPAAPSAPPVSMALPAPAPAKWLDAPQTPGDWRYAASAGTTQALFGAATAAGGTAGTGEVTLACDLSTRQVRIVRAVPAGAKPVGAEAPPAQMRVLTETLERTLDAVPASGGLVALVQSSDPLLDAMIFTKGRFALETAGAPTLYLPAYPEIGRVVEDCRSGPL